jgi:hypothetical protein
MLRSIQRGGYEGERALGELIERAARGDSVASQAVLNLGRAMDARTPAPLRLLQRVLSVWRRIRRWVTK